MAKTIETGKKYIATSILPVALYHGNGLETVGQFYQGSVIMFSGSTTINGTLYGIVASGQSGFQAKGGAPVDKPDGCLVPASNVHPANDKNGIDIVVSNQGGSGEMDLHNVQRVSLEVYVREGSKWATYRGPGLEYMNAGNRVGGSAVHIYGTWEDDRGRIWGACTPGMDQWGLLYNPNGDLAAPLNPYNMRNLDGSPTVDTEANLKRQKDPVIFYEQPKAAQNLDRLITLTQQASPDALKGLANMEGVIGIPPKIGEVADPRYMKDQVPPNNFGRTYTETFMLGNTIFSIQPARVKYLPGFSSEQKNEFLSTVGKALADGNAEDAEGLHGQLFEATPDYSPYINTVNLLARTLAIYSGIGNKTFPGTSVAYKNMDYSFYRRVSYSDMKTGGGGLWGTITSSVRAAADAAITRAINDDTYIHFYMTGDGTNISDNMSVSTRASGIESLFNNGLSEVAADLQFLLGGDFSADDFGMIGNMASTAFGGISSGLKSLGGVGATLGNLMDYGADYLKGGRLVFPQMLDDCTYDRSYSGTCRFISPSGDAEARFINCLLPLAFLLPFVLPQMLSDNMYRYPFLAKVDIGGQAHCDLACISNLRIQRGGIDGGSWTIDGLPFEVDVSFDITPLYSKLMVTGTNHPLLFLSNTALHEYLGAICGVSFTGNELQLKADIVAALAGNAIPDLTSSMLRGYYDSGVSNFIRKVFNFS